MKITDVVNEDITRRGFLQGAGAAAVAGAAGSAMAAPFRHGEYKDQMTGASQGKYSTIKSNDGRASLELSWPGQGQSYLAVDVPGKIINFGASGTAAARIKIGNGPVINTYLNRGTSGNYSWGAIFNNDIINKVLTHQGELKVEIPLYRDGGTVYNFTVEQDQTTKSYSQSNKTQIQQTSRAQEKSDREIALSTAKMPIEEKIEKNIEEFRETLPIDQKIYFRMAGTATFTLHKNGTISNLQWKDQMSVFPNKVAATPDFWQKVMPPLPPIFWGGQSELNVEVFNTGYNTILTVTNVQQSQPVQKNNIPNVQQSQPVQKNNIPQEKIRNWEPEQKQNNSTAGQSISRESVEQGLAEGMAQDEAEETNGWRAELVNQINYNTFEVKMTNTRSKESANFIVRPVDMISVGPTLQIETMDVHDLQTGQTESWTSDDPQPDGGIVYAIAMMFWDNKELQKKLWTIVDTHNTKGQDTMPGLDQRRSIGQEVDADAYIDSQEKTQDVMAKMKQGMAEDDVGEGIRVPAQQILGTKNRAKSAYYPTNVKPKVPKLDKPLTDQELARLAQLAGIKSK